MVLTKSPQVLMPLATDLSYDEICAMLSPDFMIYCAIYKVFTQTLPGFIFNFSLDQNNTCPKFEKLNGMTRLVTQNWRVLPPTLSFPLPGPSFQFLWPILHLFPF